MGEVYTSTSDVFKVAVFAAVLAAAIVGFIPESLPADRLQSPEIDDVTGLLQPAVEFSRKADTRMWLFVAVEFLRMCTLGAYMSVTLFAYKQLIPSWSDQDNGALLAFVGI